MDSQMAPHQVIGEGCLGIFALIFGVGVSFLNEVERDLRIASLLVGLLVASLTAWKLIRDLRKK